MVSTCCDILSSSELVCPQDKKKKSELSTSITLHMQNLIYGYILAYTKCN